MTLIFAQAGAFDRFPKWGHLRGHGASDAGGPLLLVSTQTASSRDASIDSPLEAV